MKQKKKKPQRQFSAREALMSPVEGPSSKVVAPIEKAGPVSVGQWLVAASLFGLFLYAYWSVLVDLVKTWWSEADYSHGFLVVPVAMMMLWFRWADRPAAAKGYSWLGFAILLLAAGIRIAGGLWYVDAVQAWSIPLWVAGVAWFLGGWRVVKWAMPAIIMLMFMIPLPYRAERLLSTQLQTVASRGSCLILQTIGQPAVREGNVVYIDDFPLNIVEACSGLRVFMSIIAVAFAYTVLVKQPWWTKICLWLSVLPVALFVNATRIAVTAMLDLHVLGIERHKLSDELAGYVMIGLAASLLAFVIWYMSRLIVQVQAATSTESLLGQVGAKPA